jgi:hypothetical protein
MNLSANFSAIKRLLLIASLSALWCVAASADTVFTNENLSPVLNGPNVFTTSTGGHVGIAAAFTPNADFLLTGASAPLSISQTALVQASIYSDSSSGLVPNSPLALFAPTTITNQIGFFSFSDPSAPVALIAGQQYWLVLSFSATAPAYYTTAVWEGGGTTSQPTAFLNFGFDSFTGANNPQFAIFGTPAPEPMEAGLAGVGLILVGFLFRKKPAEA